MMNVFLTKRIKINTSGAWIACLQALVVMGFQSAFADSPVANRPDVHVGDVWRYRTVDEFTGAQKNPDYEYRIVALSDDEIIAENGHDGDSEKRITYFSREWGAKNIAGASWEPSYSELYFPLFIGKSYSNNYVQNNVNGTTYTFSLNARVVSYEKVTVPAGTFDAFKVEHIDKLIGSSRSVYDSESSKTTVWYAPSVNSWIRWKTETIGDSRIRSRTIEDLVAYLPSRRP